MWVEEHTHDCGMKQTKTHDRLYRQWLLVGAGGVLLLALIWLKPAGDLRPTVSDAAQPGLVTSQPRSGASAPLRPGATSGSSTNREVNVSAQEVVAQKQSQFARSRREIARGLARRAHVEVPAEVDRFFAAMELGKWEEVEKSYQGMTGGGSRSAELQAVWSAVKESYGVAEVVHQWPAQQLLDYGHAVLDSLRPGMVYVGGSDAGRFIPTLLNETGEGEHHVVLTQNALADTSYVDYVHFVQGDRLATLTPDDSKQAFGAYIADATRRLEHDQEFPQEPKQLRPGEEVVRGEDGRINVSGQVAVMSINEALLETLMQKNPGLSFAMEESFPLHSTYAQAVPLGPILELRAPDAPAGVTAETAAQSLGQWQTKVQELQGNPEASASADTLKAYSHMAQAQGNLFADRQLNSEAEQAYRVGLSIWPGSSEAMLNLAGLLDRTGRGPEAAQLMADFARNYPDLSPVPQPAGATGSSSAAGGKP